MSMEASTVVTTRLMPVESTRCRERKNKKLVEVHNPALIINHDHSVGIAVVTEAQLAALRDYKLGGPGKGFCGGLGLALGKAPVGRTINFDHVVSELAQKLRADLEGRSVSGIHEHPHVALEGKVCSKSLAKRTHGVLAVAA